MFILEIFTYLAGRWSLEATVPPLVGNSEGSASPLANFFTYLYFWIHWAPVPMPGRQEGWEMLHHQPVRSVFRNKQAGLPLVTSTTFPRGRCAPT